MKRRETTNKLLCKEEGGRWGGGAKRGWVRWNSEEMTSLKFHFVCGLIVIVNMVVCES